MTTAVRKSAVSEISPALQKRTDDLLQQEIRFVYCDELESFGDQQTPVLEAAALLDELQAAGCVSEAAIDAMSSNDSDDGPVVRGWTAPDPLLTFEQEQVLFRALNLLRFRVNRMRARLSPRKPSLKSVEEMERMLDLAERIRAQLVKSNLRLVSSIARKFSSSNGDVDDFSSDGCMILLGAIDRFDYSRGFRFSTYATHSIQRHFFRAWKVRQKRRERFPNAASDMLGEIAECPQEGPICADPEEVVGKLLSRADEILDHREQQILLNRFGLDESREPRTLREIAADLGISKERVRQLQMKALDKLKELLELDGISMDSLIVPC
ncbi:MAG: sigma-70 family RNA polymerase sigma factor [Planctomyces sp.]|nr:sigma-70 family RNA polymerase sigma factor [Planctomyces sp.]